MFIEAFDRSQHVVFFLARQVVTNGGQPVGNDGKDLSVINSNN
jgi:hypothetical protein